MDRRWPANGRKQKRFSPRERGWTGAGGVPAAFFSRFPRVSGDGPPTRFQFGQKLPFSPRERGWTGNSGIRDETRECFPRVSGDGPKYGCVKIENVPRFPRVSGDGPVMMTGG